MQTVILCGGRGARMGPVSRQIPKPLITIGGKPVLWHIMKFFSHFGHNDFILCLGYKGNIIRKYFEEENGEGWKIEFEDTGLDSSKSERLAKIRKLIKGGTFFISYGDDLTDADLKSIEAFHEKNKPIITLTAVRMQSPYGVIKERDGKITGFEEKPLLNEWINGGYMVASTRLFDYLNLGDLEGEVFNELVGQGRIFAYKHYGQWKSMNTLKDNAELNDLWSRGKAFWKVW